MKSRTCLLTAACLCVTVAAGTCARAQTTQPLTLVQKFVMPANIQGHFDHITIDVRGNRLYATAESAHQVLVFNLRSGECLHSIDNIAKPNACVQCGACVVQCPEDALAFVTPAGKRIAPDVIWTYKLNMLGARAASIARE